MDICTQFAILCGCIGAVGLGAAFLGIWLESAQKEKHDEGNK